MSRPRESTTVLTGYIGYAARPEPDWALPANRLRWAKNVWMGTQHGICQRRQGSEALTLPAGITGVDLVTPVAFACYGSGAQVTGTRLITQKTTDLTKWWVQDAPNGTAWTEIAVPTIFQSGTVPTSAVTIKDKVIFGSGYHSETRLRLYDITAGTLRAAGFATPAAPTGANGGAGAYAATLRYYRVRYTTQATGVTVRRSEPSAALTFTPSGAGTHVVVTKPAALSEGETHWELEVSLDNVNWYILTTTAIATTTYNDSAATGTYSSGVLSEDVGQRLPLPACRVVALDDGRVLMGGSAILANSAVGRSRVWFTPVLGTTDIADEECVQTDNYVDIGDDNNDEITAIVGPVNDAMYVFKKQSVYRMARTGDAAAPYVVTKVLSGIGTYSHYTIDVFRDVIYFQSYAGCYQYADGVLTRLDSDLFGEGSHGDMPKPPYVYNVKVYEQRQVVFFGNYAYSMTTGGWTYHSFDGLTMQPALSQGALTLSRYGALVCRANQGEAQGLFYLDSSGNTEATGDRVVGEIWVPRLRLAGLGTAFRLTRMRLWGNTNTSSGKVSVRVYRDRTHVDHTTVVLTDDAVVHAGHATFSTFLSGRDYTDVTPQALGHGVADHLGVVVTTESTDTEHVWNLNAIELSWVPQEPLL